MRWLIVLLLLAACEKKPPPATEREAVRGLPPTSSPTTLPAGHPSTTLPAGHPPVAADDGGPALEGTIDVAPALKDQVKTGDTIFLVARSIDASGAVTRMPLAVGRLSAGALPMPFKLTAADAMMQGTAFAGTVQITARVDRDGEAMSRQPGDIEGTTKAEIPARGLKIVLDTPVKP